MFSSYETAASDAPRCSLRDDAWFVAMSGHGLGSKPGARVVEAMVAPMYDLVPHLRALFDVWCGLQASWAALPAMTRKLRAW